MKHSIKTKKVNQRGNPCKDHKIIQIKADKAEAAAVDLEDAVSEAEEIVALVLKATDRPDRMQKIATINTNQAAVDVVVGAL
jgi:hypothetical protein